MINFLWVHQYSKKDSVQCNLNHAKAISSDTRFVKKIHIMLY